VRKILLGVIVLMLLAVAVLYGYRYFRYARVSDEELLFEVAREHVEKVLDGSRVLNISISPSEAKVNYAFDKLYDVTISYERGGKAKQMTVQYGKVGPNWISPRVSDFEILDARSEGIITDQTEQ